MALPPANRAAYWAAHLAAQWASIAAAFGTPHEAAEQSTKRFPLRTADEAPNKAAEQSAFPPTLGATLEATHG